MIVNSINVQDSEFFQEIVNLRGLKKCSWFWKQRFTCSENVHGFEKKFGKSKNVRNYEKKYFKYSKHVHEFQEMSTNCKNIHKI